MRPSGIAYVYFIATADRTMVKIGCSEKPLSRLCSLKSWSPVDLEILAVVPGRVQDERAIQGHFIDRYSHREWFHSTPVMLAKIAAVAASGKLPSYFVGRDDEPNHIVAHFSIRRTPEWRAKCSAIQKARYARDKARKLIRVEKNTGAMA